MNQYYLLWIMFSISNFIIFVIWINSGHCYIHSYSNLVKCKKTKGLLIVYSIFAGLDIFLFPLAVFDKIDRFELTSIYDVFDILTIKSQGSFWPGRFTAISDIHLM